MNETVISLDHCRHVSVQVHLAQSLAKERPQNVTESVEEGWVDSQRRFKPSVIYWQGISNLQTKRVVRARIAAIDTLEIGTIAGSLDH